MRSSTKIVIGTLMLVTFVSLLGIISAKVRLYSQRLISSDQLQVIQRNENDDIDLHSGHKAVIVFSPSDCGVCLEIIEHLNAIYQQDQSGIPVIGIIDTPYPQAIVKMQMAYDFFFPLLYDSSGEISNLVDKHSKPVLILSDDGVIKKKAHVGDPEDARKVNDILQTLKRGDEQ